MIVESIKENLKDIPSLNDYHLERVYLEPEQLLKRILRVKSDHGTEIGINLIENQKLHDGDILYKDKNTIIAIFANSSNVIKITPKDIHDMGYIAHQLGNRHLPAVFEGDVMYVEYDYLVERLLKQLNIAYVVEDKKMSEPFRHISIEGGHDEVSHDVRKDMNKDADKVTSSDLHAHEHAHDDLVHSHEHNEEDKNHEHSHDVQTVEHMHTHEHNHGEYKHTHEHLEGDNHEHIHNHNHEHKHDGMSHSHLHKVTDHHHDHNDFKNGSHTHDHNHKHEEHEHEHTHHSHDNE